eukprot:12366106-Prorocentrum_lima.AAC.1
MSISAVVKRDFDNLSPVDITGMLYKKLVAPVCMVVVADAAYKKQTALHCVAFSYCLWVVRQ